MMTMDRKESKMVGPLTVEVLEDCSRCLREEESNQDLARENQN